MLAFLALGTLVAAAVAALSLVISIWLGALLVGVGLFAIAGGLAFKGKTDLSLGSPPIPEEAVASTKEDMAWIKSQATSARP